MNLDCASLAVKIEGMISVRLSGKTSTNMAEFSSSKSKSPLSGKQTEPSVANF